MMTKNLTAVFIVFLIISFGAALSFGCSLNPEPVDKFDPAQYVFIGKVVAVTQQQYQGNDWLYDSQTHNYSMKKVTRDACGVKVKIVESVNTPEQSEFYEVYPLQHNPSCELYGLSRDELVKEFPVGSKVAVIARESSFLQITLPREMKILESGFPKGSLTKIKSGAETSAASVFNYEGFDESESGTSDCSLLKFELAKDLWELSGAQDETERIDITKRLLFYPYMWELDYTKIVEREIKDDETKKSLIRQWEERKQKVLDNANYRTD